jgi:hypothetical protein
MLIDNFFDRVAPKLEKGGHALVSKELMVELAKDKRLCPQLFDRGGGLACDKKLPKYAVLLCWPKCGEFSFVDLREKRHVRK